MQHPITPKSLLCQKRKADGLCGRSTKSSTRETCPGCDEYYRSQAAEKRRVKRESGLCVHCGKPAQPPHSMCAECLAYMRNQNTARRNQYRMNGRCARCGGQTEPGKVHCTECIGKFRYQNRKRKLAKEKTT